MFQGQVAFELFIVTTWQRFSETANQIVVSFQIKNV